MKIFMGGPESWNQKINFADENNVVLGYDMGQSCCENADWFIADTPTEKIVDRTGDDPDLSGWSFDPAYFKEVSRAAYSDGSNLSGSDYNALDEGGMVIFRIVKGDQEKFIHLFNCHNGYYGHGFTFKVGEAVSREGGL